MSAIGDYVHRTAQGYREHGIYANGSRGWDYKYRDYGAMSQDIKKRANSLSRTGPNKQEREVLAKVLQSMVNKVKSPDSEIRRQIEAEMLQRFKNLQNINWDTLDVTAKHKNFLTKEALTQLGFGDRKDIILNPQQMHASMTAIMDVLNKQLAGEQIDQSVVDEAKALQALYEKNIAKLAAAIEGTLGQQTLKSIGKLAEGRELLDFQQKYWTFLQTYIALPPLRLQKGDLFEILIEQILDGATVFAEEEALNMAEKTLVKSVSNVGKGIGRQRVAVTYDPSRFSGGAQSFQGSNQSLLTTRYSQGKIDVQFNWGKKQVKASVKNYWLNEHTRVHLVTGTGLSYLLQNESAYFVNHFLNLVAEHEDIKQVPDWKEKHTDIMDSMKLLLTYLALTGENQGNAANLFIVHDRISGSVLVYSMSEIINSVSNRLSAASVGIGKDTTNNIRNLTLKNNPAAPSAKQRIYALLSDFHTKKISVAVQLPKKSSS